MLTHNSVMDIFFLLFFKDTSKRDKSSQLMKMWFCGVFALVIPTPLKQWILGELHEEHLGMFRMKALARSFVWWPGTDQDIETTIKSFQNCTRVANTPACGHGQNDLGSGVHIDFAEH